MPCAGACGQQFWEEGAQGMSAWSALAVITLLWMSPFYPGHCQAAQDRGHSGCRGGGRMQSLGGL
eukprot:4549168-Pyramimonas_sp.AAC.1